MRTGLFLSRDDGMISRAIDLESLVDHFGQIEVCKVYDNFFRPDDQSDMLRTVKEKRLDAVVLAGSSPRQFEATLNADRLLDSLTDLGVNRNKVAFANINELVAMPHLNDKERATEKAQSLIDVQLAKVQILSEVKSVHLAPRRAVLIVGATAAGVVAAGQFLEKGYKVYFIDKNQSFGFKDEIEKALLPSLTMIESHDKSRIIFGAVVKDFSGWCGDYEVLLQKDGVEETIEVGGVVLSVGNDTELIGELKSKMQLDTDAEGFIKSPFEGHLSYRTADPGILYVPYEKENQHIAPDVAHASMVVLSLITILDRDEIQHPEWVTDVSEHLCGACGTCVKTCAFSAAKIDLTARLAYIDARRCKGCGNCVVACPTGARNLVKLPESYVFRAIDIMSRGVSNCSDPKILAILCNTSGYSAADAAGRLIGQDASAAYSPNVMPLRIQCGGSIDTQYIFSALQAGFDGVILCICEDCKCHYMVGNTDMERRLSLFREVLRSRNIDDGRLRITHLSPGDGKQFVTEVASFSELLNGMRG
jgi:heterodisulfide reductase subunit A-like polyferredoxin/coenzyme F420-reducing hydrogenase delta subunit